MHHLQKLRAANFNTVKLAVIHAMPSGIKDDDLKAFLMRSKGFSKPKVEEYLTVLESTREIEKIDGVWHLVPRDIEQHQTEECVEDADQ